MIYPYTLAYVSLPPSSPPRPLQSQDIVDAMSAAKAPSETIFRELGNTKEEWLARRSALPHGEGVTSMNTAGETEYGKAKRQSLALVGGSTSTASNKNDELWGINPDHIEVGPFIGAGGFGKVYEGVYQGTHVAIKKIVFEGDSLSDAARASFRAECDVNLLLR